MAEGERATGTPNTIYDLSSVLFHTLEGEASYDTYIEDAEQEADQELADFFRRVRDVDSVRADDARLLLARRTLTAAEPEDAAPSAVATGESVPGVGTTEGSEPDVPPRTQPRVEGAPSWDARGEYTVTKIPDEDLTPPEDAVPPDVPESPGGTPSRADAGQSPRTEPISAPPGLRDVLSRRTEEASPAGQDRSRRADRDLEDKGLVEEIKDAVLDERDAILDEEKRGGEGTGREDRR
jgi:hypothetical protein